jgi:ubiquitin C-terminal hydrolase
MKHHSIIPQLFQSCTLYQYRNPVSKEKEFFKIEHDYRIGVSVPEANQTTLYDCLKETFKDEVMSGDNAWYDEKNQIKKSVYKQSALCHLPTFLILHFKRWREDLSKKQARIESPLVLDMSPFTIYSEACRYQLFGIINQDGGIDGGHYYSYVYKNDQWFSLNDGFVQSISEDSLFHSGNYCLFYRKIK